MMLMTEIDLWMDEAPEFIKHKLKRFWSEILIYYQPINATSINAIPANAATTNATIRNSQADNQSSELAPKVWPLHECPYSVLFIKELIAICSRSDFVRESLARYPHWLSLLADETASANAKLHCSKNISDYRAALLNCCEHLEDESSFMVAIREYRRFEMIRIIWRDLLKIACFEETVKEVTYLADVCVLVALDFAQKKMAEKFGTPLSKGKNPQAQKMLVLALGKHGAQELNVSSDIDLIFAYPHTGETNHPTKPIDNQSFFTRVGQKFIQLLDQVTSDGFVFRVDMRLRPYGDSGSLVLNFAAFEDYYANQGREWERFAMIKARVVNVVDNREQAEGLISIIHPFVFRRYTDFSSIQALRDMKRLIRSDVQRKGGDNNIKLGRGGIREVEFIAQACQLIYGGRDEGLQQTGLLSVYEVLKQEKYLPAVWVDTLVSGYRFLRNLEHAIQGLADQQTQLIPNDKVDRERIAWSMLKGDTATWKSLESTLSKQRNAINAIFNEFLSDPSALDETVSSASANKWLVLWQANAGEHAWENALQQENFKDTKGSYQQLQVLRENRLFSLMSGEANRRFECFLPKLMAEVALTKSPSTTLERVLGLVNVILGRTVYLVLLYENASALKQLCHLCSCSPWVAEHLAKNPIILDELLDASSLYHPPRKSELRDELRQQLLRIPEDDLEAQMICLRIFKNAHMLRVAAAELGDFLPLMKVSDYLTILAETILDQAINIVWSNLVSKHGLPSGIEGYHNAGEMDDYRCKGFAVVGYGKLGGIELAYSSDLDLVFLYDTNEQGMTSGEHSINNQLFYTRLGQRAIHIMATQTQQGQLYDIDMRLRPSGNSGMLVSSIKAFEKYQNEGAWTWEHQALVRARGIAGDPELIERFNLVRDDVLSQKRKLEMLRAEVSSMRQKMKEQNDCDDIKQGEGGLVDIEFITQFGVLGHAYRQPSLLVHSDNIRILEDLSRARCFGDVDISPLVPAYRALRSALHRKSLAAMDDQSETLRNYPSVRQQVQAIWQQIFQPVI